MYVYIQSEPGLYTVGFYSPNGQWHPESDHANRSDAADRVILLNGGKSNKEYQDYLKSNLDPRD